MHRCGSVFLLTLAIIFVAALAGCLGKSTPGSGSGGVQSVTLSPGSNVSLDVGATRVFSATGKDANGRVVLGVNIQYLVGVPQGTTSAAPLSIANNGNACAGTWDASVAICSPGTPGIALVTAVINGISSPPTTVYVHQHVASIQIANAESQEPNYDCFSQRQTWLYKGIAYNAIGQDITNSVGPMNWSSSNAGVVTTTPYVPPAQPNVLNQVQTTAKAPGITQLFASVANTYSSPVPYTTCLIQAIYLQIGGQAQAGNSITVSGGGSISINAAAIDTLFNKVDFAALPTPPLTWSTTNPEVATFGSTTNTAGTNSATARNNFGGATLSASCTPPSCNIGVLPGLPIYSSNGVLPNGTNGYGTIAVDVTLSTNSKTPTYTAWAATTDCQDAPGCSSALFSVTPGTSPIGSIVSVSRTPNSLMFNHVASARIYIGSDEGLMYLGTSSGGPTVIPISNSSTPCNVALCGKILTISNDGNQVVVSDTVSTPSQVYIYNAGSGGSAPVDLILTVPGEKATAAAFSPDQLKLFIFTDAGNMYVYSTVDALTELSLAAPATDVSFSADGSFAYVAGTPAGSVSAYSTCSLPTTPSVNIGTVAASSTPVKIFPSPVIPLPVAQNGLLLTEQSILALEPPNIEFLTAEFTQDPIVVDNQFTCNPPVIPPGTFTKGPSFNLGQGNFTPLYSQLVADGTEVLLVAENIPAVLLFNVNEGTTTSVPLARPGFGSSFPLAAASSTDGSQVFVAACDQYAPPPNQTTCAVGSVHIVGTTGQGDYQQVPYVNNNNLNMCGYGGNPTPQCLPNLIAIKPQ